MDSTEHTLLAPKTSHRRRNGTGTTPARSVRVSDEIWEAARERAAAEGVTISYVICLLLHGYAEEIIDTPEIVITEDPVEPMVQGEGMNFNDYQDATAAFAKYPEAGTGSPYALAYVGLGLGEAGEVQGKIKKILRDDGGMVTDAVRQALLGELGDVLWYVAAACRELDLSMDEVAQRNVAKLQSRFDRGVIGGSGDNR